MKEMNGAEVLVKSLEDLGIKHVFGYTGAAILPVFHALQKSSIEIVINSNEQSAAFSAAGYSRSGKGIGVAMVTSGPAITNTLTSVADACGDSIPLLIFAGQVPEHKIGTDSFQHINVKNIFGDAAKKVIQLSNNEDVESMVKDAYYFAKSGKPGPVVIDFPLDKQQKMHGYRSMDVTLFEQSYRDDRHLNEAQCKAFFQLLANSKKPLLYLGGGLNSRKASQAIREFNEYFKIPSVNTLMAKGIMDERNALNLGMLGMFGTPYANMIIQENDFFFAIGVRWDDRIAEKVGFGIEADIAYIDINPEKMHQIKIERFPKFTLIGDGATALMDLLDYAKKHNIKLEIAQWRQRARELKKSWPLDYNRTSDRIQSAEVLDILSACIDENVKITTGVGNHQMLAAQYLSMQVPNSFMTSGSFGTMGFAIPTAIGVHYANPDHKIIAIDGDGSLRMNLGELHTIVNLSLPIKILLLNNRSDAMVLNLQDVAYAGIRTGTERQKDVNFAAIARSFGFNYTARITEREKLEGGIKAFLDAQGPCFLEILTDREEVLYPKVPAGSAYKDMILGPYIKQV
ncbi:acetolactate synthase large subunit [Methanohalophilus euhalobius]|uniref:Acetolactate synthase large subunit n=1 Tax=Methanohalophilus euhalobius TaxID=51203 RepID=A0A285GC48_9EURY|nr:MULTISPECIES: thiamine pyrophosphate-binding protein [Methanohalophilus]ODV50169.1 MAG: acetolactate synthase I/II/III large subunit [Methanohalophilus sp. 2-GBenrich]TCL12080.1 acetolactate synthase large subunit [Methanohalophilus euhalobius]SNY20988.1 acetolactate synthase, large subunit [Methanohalophilus euhalobius]